MYFLVTISDSTHHHYDAGFTMIEVRQLNEHQYYWEANDEYFHKWQLNFISELGPDGEQIVE